ncbi:papain-like cysteine peptidase [Acanthamoeba polyphaga mimivirus]|uniref:Papain-like cysteine peptidase n=2 Tax=Megamimivirinae TaxID=3044648 RepID=A0A2L2DJA0_MIMIV|nr:putative papain-like cysteine peptidase [Megavirus chiliensis]AEQ32622.1 putative papain-like cysteine peptidase [Megavirus chiliensis]AVG46216.1 papain-like cysteine peptidase [Acanthamoeba polyphaga mimivirus]AVG47322.1 papain-like cysteine peptidase [Acanthamoeba polyphaga mimivirus]
MTIYISLGSTCGVAYQLQMHHLRDQAMPFDWVKCLKLSSVIEIIENGFNSFGSYENICFHAESQKHPVLTTDSFPNNINNVSKSFIYKNKLGVMFYHDFDKIIENEFDDTYQTFKNKYTRRFDRFYETLASGKNIVLIRDEQKPHLITTKIISDFVNTIHEKIKNNTIINIIIIINNPKCKSYEWIITAQNLGIKIINDTEKIKSWQRNNLDWASIITK